VQPFPTSGPTVLSLLPSGLFRFIKLNKNKGGRNNPASFLLKKILDKSIMKIKMFILVLVSILITGYYSQGTEPFSEKITKTTNLPEDSVIIIKHDEKRSAIKVWSTQERDLLINGLERTRNELINEIKELSDAQWNFKEDSSRWSVAEIVEHLFAQNESYRIEMRTVLNQPELPQFVHKAKENDQVFLDYASDTLKADAGILSPIGRFCSKEKSIFAFNRTHDILIYMVSSSDKDFRKHFTFRNYISDGHLSNAEIYNIRDIHQLMLTCIAHMDRHLNQLRKVKSNSDYP
jgi:hypothetical protein